MKYNLQVKYAGQSHTFTNLELDDERISDESYPEGREANNYAATENFWENVEVEVVRLPASAASEGKGADPEGKNICFECGKPATQRNSLGWGLCDRHALEESKGGGQ